MFNRYRNLKLIAFFVILAASVIVCIVLAADPKNTVSDKGNLLAGTLTVSRSQNKGWIQRNPTLDLQTPPVLSLEGEESVDVEIGGTAYTEPGFTAKDAQGGDISQNVSAQIEGDRLVYTVTDNAGNKAQAFRTIHYVDHTPPEIILNGEEELHLPVGTAYSDPGFSATDNVDGDLTSRVVVAGEVDNYQLGEYPITYTVTDSEGNEATAVRKVIREGSSANPDSYDPNKVIYLTFDDGPGDYTEDLLDILDVYGVKVTFFVTNQFPNHQNLIKEEVERGHSVGVHSLTHEFDIYSSEETFFEDFYAMYNIIYEQSGLETRILRFIGGTSNTLSAEYCVGIMSVLAEDVLANGFQYFDWNVSSGDAGQTQDSSEIVSNVINGILENGDMANVVLMHDIWDYSVNAVESIIVWGLENGYTFLPLDYYSPECHHPVLN